ncbi:hypothetical protein DXN04_01565 [Chitinophaga silvisoli]|uniref:Cytochrome c n=1 Tax=Chitinophaga silvisoli TaxID=2291814 RepID=A0A3E1P7T0_9BACT|nr:hypothetical protein DXN04_01565 [Chitinophaga silvisoli]
MVNNPFSSFATTPPGDEVSKKYCAGCHGDQMQGGVATALIKTNWKSGGDRPLFPRWKNNLLVTALNTKK